MENLSSRTMSAFPLSVGTSLAFESLFNGSMESIDPARIIPQRVNINNYNEFWINVGTLFRNMYSSISKDIINSITIGDFKLALMEEMEVIRSLAKVEGKGKNVVFYLCSYDEVEDTTNKFVHIRGISTPIQRIFNELYIQSCRELVKIDNTILLLNGTLKPKTLLPNAIIITHFAYDLCSYKNFNVLDLLESHTGVLKNRGQWYTKYYQGSELVNIPFKKGLLKVFGDKEHFRPADLKIRQDVIKLAKSHNWTQLTTNAKLKADIKNLKNPYFSAILEEII
jgi:hypothetical protein